MRVVCIEDGFLPSDLVCPRENNIFDLKEGDEYTVIDSFVTDGYCWYVLSEDPDNTEEIQYGYDSLRFSSLTGTESAVEEAIEIINLEPVVITEPKKKWYQKIFQ